MQERPADDKVKGLRGIFHPMQAATRRGRSVGVCMRLRKWANRWAIRGASGEAVVMENRIQAVQKLVSARFTGLFSKELQYRWTELQCSALAPAIEFGVQ